LISLYVLVVERISKYCVSTPLWSWTSACAIPSDEAIRQISVMVTMFVLGLFVAYVCEEWRRNVIEEYRGVLRKQNLLKDRDVRKRE
jgi:hypothetical protein